MSWILEGKTVEGLYLGSIPVRGVVTESRVKYGGRVAHTVRLDAPVRVFRAMRDSVILEVTEIVRVVEENTVATIEFDA